MDTLLFIARLIGMVAVFVIVYSGYREAEANKQALNEQADLIADLLRERSEMQDEIDRLTHELHDYGVRD